MTTLTLVKVVSDKLHITAADTAARVFNYNDIISRQWLIEAFEINEPMTGSRRDFEKTQLMFMDCIEGFRNHLLESHKMYLTSVRGIGYRIVLPKEQSDFAMNKMKNVVVKEIRRAKSSLMNVNELHLSLTEIKYRDEQLGKIAALAAFNRKKGLTSSLTLV